MYFVEKKLKFRLKQCTICLINLKLSISLSLLYLHYFFLLYYLLYSTSNITKKKLYPNLLRNKSNRSKKKIISTNKLKMKSLIKIHNLLKQKSSLMMKNKTLKTKYLTKINHNHILINNKNNKSRHKIYRNLCWMMTWMIKSEICFQKKKKKHTHTHTYNYKIFLFLN